MSSYRDEAREVAKETRWTFFRFLPIFIGAVVILTALGFGLRSLGLIGSTIVEREVFERSYQRSEALKAQIAVDQATITEIEMKLRNPNLDENTRYNLNAQLSAARVRISTTQRKQN